MSSGPFTYDAFIPEPFPIVSSVRRPLAFRGHFDGQTPAQHAGWGGGVTALDVAWRYLRFHVQDGDQPLLVDLADGLQLGPVHGVLMAAILQVLVV